MKTTNTTAAETRNQVINDFGAKIGGARKDMYAAAREWAEQLAEITAEQLAAAGLSKLVRLPNLEKLTEAGAISAPAARAALTVWRTIERKPTYGATYWAERTRVKLDTIAADLTGGDITADITDAAEFQVLTAANWPAVPFSFGRYSVKKYSSNYGGPVRFRIVATRYYYGESSTDPANIAEQIRALVAADDAKKQANNGPELAVYKNRAGVYFVAPKGKAEIILKTYDTAAEAFTDRTQNRAALVARYNDLKNFPALRREWNRPRLGEDWRKGANMTPESFAAGLPFRGVEFGNWVTQTERAALLNSAFDGFHDLAAVLGITPAAVCLGGSLAFAFASRGHSGAAAHYEPARRVINLTKKNGAGCMAHEWFHAVDNWAAGGGVNNYATEQRAHGAAFAILQAIKKTDYYTRSANLAKIKGNAYWIEGRELAARAFEGVIMNLLNAAGICSDFLANVVNYDEFTAADVANRSNYYPYPTESESAALLPYYVAFLTEVFGSVTVPAAALAQSEAATIKAEEDRREAEKIRSEKAAERAAALKAAAEKAAAETAAHIAENERRAAEKAAELQQLAPAFKNIKTDADEKGAYIAALFNLSEIVVIYLPADHLGKYERSTTDGTPGVLKYKQEKGYIKPRYYGRDIVKCSKPNAAACLDVIAARGELRQLCTDSRPDFTRDIIKEAAARNEKVRQTLAAAGVPTEPQKSPQSDESKAGGHHTAPNANNATEATEKPAAGLELVSIPGGVAVTGDSRTTYKNRKAIKAHGATWNRDAQQWQATDTEAVASLRAWFGVDDEPTPDPDGTAAPVGIDATETANESDATPTEAAESTQTAPTGCNTTADPESPTEAAETTTEGTKGGRPVMMKQFASLKAKHPDAVLLFRVGDFYELYESDADTAADVLGIIVTRADGYRFAAFPHHALDIYLPKLIRTGHRVAICDQLEAPKATAKRSTPTAIVSQGTPTESSTPTDPDPAKGSGDATEAAQGEDSNVIEGVRNHQNDTTTDETADALFDVDGETFRKGDRVVMSYVDPYEGGLFTAVGILTNFSPSMSLAEVTTDEGKKRYAHYTAVKHTPTDPDPAKGSGNATEAAQGEDSNVIEGVRNHQNDTTTDETADANTITLPEAFGDLCWDTYGKASAIVFGNIDDHAAQLEALGGVRRSVNYSTLRTGKAKKSDRTDAYYFGKRYAQNPGAYVKRVNNALFDAVWKVCPRIETLAADYKEGDRVRTIYGPGVVINGDNIHKPSKNCVWVQLDGTTYNYGWAGTPHKYVEVSDRDMMLIEAAPTDPEQGDGVQPSQTAQNENTTVIEPVRNHRISTAADEIKAAAFDAPQWAKVGAVCRYNESHAVVKILKTMNEHKGALVEFCSCCKDEKPFFLSYEYMKPYECPEWCKVGARVVRNHPYYTASNGLHGTIINRYDDWSFVVQWDDSFKERDVWYFDLLAETEAKKESVCNVPEWAEVGKSVGHYLDYGDGTGDMLFGEVTEHERMEDGGVLVHFGGYIAPLDKIRPYTPADKEKNVTDDSGSYCHVSKSDVLGDNTDTNRPKQWAVDMTPKEFWRLQSDWDADELPEEDAEIIGHYFHADFGLAGAMTVFVHGYAGNEAHAMVTVYHVDGLSHDEESFVQNVLPIATFFPLLTPERGWQRMTAKEIEERRACL